MGEMDVIIIGAGPNGLEAACYLSKAGLGYLVLPILTGPLTTVW